MINASLSTVITLEGVWLRFLDLVFVYQTVAFVLLFYLVVSKSGSMREYRWCLMTNVISMYANVVGLYIYKPYFLAEGVYVIALGPVCRLGSQGQFYYLIGVNLLSTCHGLAIGICVVYQALQMPPAAMAAVTDAITGFVFRSKVQFLIIYFVAALGIWLMVAAYFLRSNVQFVTPEMLSKNASAYDPLLFNYLSSKTGVILLHPEQSQWVVPLAILLAITVLSITGFIIHLTLKNREMLKQRSKKSAALMVALNRSVLAQLSVIVVLYIVPLELATVATVAFRDVTTDFYVPAALAHFMFAVYPPLNYTMVFVFVRQYRRELARLAGAILTRVLGSKRRNTSSSIYLKSYTARISLSNTRAF